MLTLTSGHLIQLINMELLPISSSSSSSSSNASHTSTPSSTQSCNYSRDNPGLTRRRMRDNKGSTSAWNCQHHHQQHQQPPQQPQQPQQPHQNHSNSNEIKVTTTNSNKLTKCTSPGSSVVHHHKIPLSPPHPPPPPSTAATLNTLWRGLSSPSWDLNFSDAIRSFYPSQTFSSRVMLLIFLTVCLLSDRCFASENGFCQVYSYNIKHRTSGLQEKHLFVCCNNQKERQCEGATYQKPTRTEGTLHC